MAGAAKAEPGRSTSGVVEQGLVLVTERLLLREFEPGDTDSLLNVLGNHVAMQ